MTNSFRIVEIKYLYFKDDTSNSDKEPMYIALESLHTDDSWFIECDNSMFSDIYVGDDAVINIEEVQDGEENEGCIILRCERASIPNNLKKKSLAIYSFRKKKDAKNKDYFLFQGSTYEKFKVGKFYKFWMYNEN